MIQLKHIVYGLLGVVLASACPRATAADSNPPIRALVVVGGHGFDTNQFYATLRGLPGVSVDIYEHPKAQAQWEAGQAGRYDVMVLYDFYQKIDEAAKANFVKWLKDGRGLVCTHHAMANYQAWPEYENIIGARYYLKKTLVNGVEKPLSTWKHDVMVPVKIADADHPVTRGLKDFEIHDETYGLYDVRPDNHWLLTTTEKTSHEKIGWTRSYEGARVVYLELGHDHLAYANEHYQKLLGQAIRWAAKK
jgi:type 1 glutamine amidotransferase